MFVVLPLIFALIIAQTARESGVGIPERLFGLPGTAAVIGVVVLSLMLWTALHAAVARLYARHINHDRIAWWDRLGLGAALLVQALWCHALGMAALSTSSVILVLPFVLLLLLQWATMNRAVDRVTGRQLDRFGLVRQRFSFGLMPALVILCLIDAATWLLELVFGDLAALGVTGMVLTLAAPLAVLLILPTIIAHLWRVRPMPPGPQRDLLLDGCRRMRVRVHRIMHWPSSGGRFYNAAVLGMLPRLRYVLFSDDLLDALADDELQAVLGHELGHIRHRHLWWYLLFLAVCALWTVLIMVAVGPWLPALPLLSWLDPGSREAVVLVLLYALQLRLLFGMVSRACERQADLAGADLAGSPEAMQQALAKVARLSGQDPATPSWRHHSIAERIAFLEQVRLDPGRETWHQGRIMKMRILIFAALLVALLLFQVHRRGTLEDWREREPRLDKALSTADDGDPTRLRMWLDSATQQDVQALAERIYFTHIEQTPSELYPLRYRFIPFTAIDTGRERLNAALDNLVVYLLVAGPEHLRSEDRPVVERILPRLEEQATEDAAFADTVGYAWFELGDPERAARWFRDAIRLNEQRLQEAADDPEATDKIQRESNLARLRLEAIEQGAERLPRDPDDPEPAVIRDPPTDEPVEEPVPPPADTEAPGIEEARSLPRAPQPRRLG